jgi:hypothetical protein
MRLYVPLNRQEYEALERLAYAERRRPQDQAAVLLARTLADDPTQPPADQDHASVITSTASPTPRETEHVPA